MGSTGSSGGGEKIVISGLNPASTICLPIEDTRVSFITRPCPPSAQITAGSHFTCAFNRLLRCSVRILGAVVYEGTGGSREHGLTPASPLL